MQLLVLLFVPVVIVIGVTLAIVAGAGDGAWKGTIHPGIVTIFGILVPLAVFFLSLFLSPMTLGDARYGWVECWHLGKLALTPVVLWASTSLWLFEGRLKENRAVHIGLLMGASVALICLVYGLKTIRLDLGRLNLFLLVPLYIGAWYSIRAWEMMLAYRIGWIEYCWTVVISLPFWIVSIVWSRGIYKGLPPTSGCFVVTAASRGHERFVGPFFEVQHRDQLRRANRQLITLWAFEALWRARAPRSHAIFRRAYNWLGPRIASQIKSPWLADLVWLALKPCEWFARLAMNIFQFSTTCSRPVGTSDRSWTAAVLCRFDRAHWTDRKRISSYTLERWFPGFTDLFVKLAEKAAEGCRSPRCSRVLAACPNFSKHHPSFISTTKQGGFHESCKVDQLFQPQPSRPA